MAGLYDDWKSSVDHPEQTWIYGDSASWAIAHSAPAGKVL